MRYAALREPISQLQQIVSESREALLLFPALPPGLRPQHTGGNTLLMYVQTATARINNFHRATPFHRAASDASKKRKSPTRALRNFRRLQFVVLHSVPAILVGGLCSLQSSSASVATWLSATLSQLDSIFILRCGPLGTM